MFVDDPEFPGVIPPVGPIAPQFTPAFVPGWPASVAPTEGSSMQAAIAKGGAMARFISQHPDPWGWNPLPYCDLPTQFMHVPKLPYLLAWFISSLAPRHAGRVEAGLATPGFRRGTWWLFR